MTEGAAISGLKRGRESPAKVRSTVVPVFDLAAKRAGHRKGGGTAPIIGRSQGLSAGATARDGESSFMPSRVRHLGITALTPGGRRPWGIGRA